MNRKTLWGLMIALVAAVIVIPAYAHQVHDRNVTASLVIADQGEPAHNAEAILYVAKATTHGFDTESYKIDLSANDLDDARTRFFRNHVVDGVYQFVQHEKGSDHLYIIERTQVLRTEIHMK